MSQFPTSLLRWSQISFPGAFFWGLQTASSHWGPDLENRVGAEAIHVVLPTLQSTYDTVHCLGDRTLFFFICDLFWRFLPSNAPIMLYNIRYWWVFFSQSNWWTKYLAHPKLRRQKTCLLMFASLITLNGFQLLLSTQLTAELTPEWSSGFMFDPLSHIYVKNFFCCIETVANHILNLRRVVVFPSLWANV